MSTLTTYRTAIKLKGFDAIADATIDEATQEARRRIFADRRWSFLESSNATLSTTAGTSTVSLATITDLAHIDAVRLSDASGKIAIDWRPWTIIRDLQDRYDETGTPQLWSRRGTNLVFYPQPTSVLTVTVEYASYPGDLGSVATDVIPGYMKDLVVWAASVPLAYRQRDIQASSAADQYYTKVLLPRFYGQDQAEQRQTSEQVRSGYWGGR